MIEGRHRQRNIFEALNQPAHAMVARRPRQLEQILPLVGRVVAQTRARIFQGDTHYRDKLLSLFEPPPEARGKGKAAKPTEFGKLVKLQAAEHQMVVAYQVYQQRPDDRTLLIPTIEAHLRAFGRVARGWWRPIGVFGPRPTSRPPNGPGLSECAFPPWGNSALSNGPSSASAGFVAASDSVPAASGASACLNGVTAWPAAATGAWTTLNAGSDGAW